MSTPDIVSAMVHGRLNIVELVLASTPDVSVQQSPAPDWLTYIPALSFLLAVVALIVSLMNRRTSNRALELSEAQEERRKAALDVSIKEARKWRDASGDRHIAIRVLAVNPTDRDGSIVEATLRVTQTVAGKTLVLQVGLDSQTVPYKDITTTLIIPCNMKANSGIEEWLVFSLRKDLVSGQVDRYDLFLRDSRGPEETLDVWALEEEIDES